MSAAHITMANNGRLVIPAAIRDQIGMPRGGSFVVHVEGRQVRLEPIEQAIARVQALVRQYVPEGVSLADELLAERRAEADGE